MQDDLEAYMQESREQREELEAMIADLHERLTDEDVPA